MSLICRRCSKERNHREVTDNSSSPKPMGDLTTTTSPSTKSKKKKKQSDKVASSISKTRFFSLFSIEREKGKHSRSSFSFLSLRV